MTIPIQANTLDEASARLPQGVYTTFRTFGKRTRVLGLKQHLERLEYSARRTGHLEPVDHAALRIAIREGLLRMPGEAEVRLRITLDLVFEAGALFVSLLPMQPLPPEIYDQGVRLRSTSLHRQAPDVKSTTFMVDSQAERRAMPEGVFELIMLDELGRILEGLTSNFFAVRSGIIYTAREDVLSGVTRQAVLDLARAHGQRIILEPFSMAAIGQLDEAFITSSSRGLVPVVQINEIIIGSGVPGPVYNRLSKAYIGFVARTAEEIN